MTFPREILPGRCYLVTRRCTQRQFLLRPDNKTNHAFRYCLADAAQRFGIGVIAWTAMSNHYHAVIYDARGELPDFLAHFHKMTAKVLNARWGRWENLWATESTSAVYLVEGADVLDKVIYTLANPVAGHLVERVVDWPGESSLWHLDGKPIVVQRPAIFFRKRGAMPASVTLRAELPPGLTEEDRARWVARIRAMVADRERRARAYRTSRGVRVVGRRTILRTSALARPQSIDSHRQIKPVIACKAPDRRQRALNELQVFRRRYVTARREFASGLPRVCFPPGTYALRKLGVVCAAYCSTDARLRVPLDGDDGIAER